MTLISDAMKVGLSAKAAAVYVALLEAGSALSPKAIILQSKLHRQYAYDGLRELEIVRLAVKEGAGRSVRYKAASPDTLLKEAEKRRLDTLDGVRSLMSQYDRSPAGVVEIVRGRSATLDSELQLMRDARHGDFLDVVGGAGMHWVHLFGELVEEWEVLRKEKQVRLRYIGEDEDVQYNREESIIEHESRTIHGIGNMVNVAIRPESVSFNIYEPEVMAVRVRSKSAVESQRALFEELWKIAK